ncbi:gamma-tocopherol methyltransferase, chloroplastic-like [Nicotiana sylvestris]|uniref:Probable tocopherol O-methyltransferase, chloroplastic n=1 Tax=Nicotiana sylvestris TaxID=4096 RepID=A0A1U7XT52_NICSY|nr:PREDICTED: probable tocopherol O-methyltransferase, chloroplastic [Nicotiana sylvestris]
MGSTCYSAYSIQSLNPTCPSSLIFTLHKPQLQQIHNIKETTRRSVRTCNSNTRTRRRMTGVAAMNDVSTPEIDVQNQQELKKGIAELYDESSGIWEDIWGDHMHHGFYEPQSSVALSDHRAAQIRMIERALRFASVSDDLAKKPRSIVDVGCGIGGSSRYLAKKYGATAQGITLSPVQAERAQALAAAQGLGDKIQVLPLGLITLEMRHL